uniref:Uncharacterized protein n=1 Tax=Micrurus spixii TaxID=129469 RepID=A0A2D4MBP8_9SAUR
MFAYSVTLKTYPKETKPIKNNENIVQEFCCNSVPFLLCKTKAIVFLWARAAKIYSLCQGGGSVFLEKESLLSPSNHMLHGLGMGGMEMRYLNYEASCPRAAAKRISGHC